MVIINGRAAQRFIVRWVTFCKPKRNIAVIAMQNDYNSLSLYKQPIIMYLLYYSVQVPVSLFVYISLSTALGRLGERLLPLAAAQLVSPLAVELHFSFNLF